MFLDFEVWVEKGFRPQIRIARQKHEGGHCGAGPIFVFCRAAEDIKKTHVPQVKKIYPR